MKDTTPETALPRLHYAYLRTLEDSATLNDNTVFRDELWDAMHRCLTKNNLVEAKAVVTYFLKNAMDRWPEAGNLSHTIDELDYLIQLINKYALVGYVLAEKNQANMLAGICMAHALLSCQSWNTYDSRNIDAILYAWKGQPITVTSIRDVADCLYSPAAWELYRDDVTDNSLMISHLWELQLPLPACSSNQTSCTNAVTEHLPADIA